jgi:hypothetical protein
MATATARATAVAVEVYDGYQNVVAAYQNFKEGNYGTGALHAGLAVLNAAGVKGGLRQLKNDVHLAAFPNAHCFPAGTPIATELGLRPIESIECNDRVWSFDLMTGKWELCRVAETYERDHDGDLVEVFVGGSATESTYHHPYWVLDGADLADRPEPDHVRAATVRDAVVPGRWVDAGDLCIGDVLLLQDGRREPITEILLRQAACRVYNLAVEGLRNYAVGPQSVLAHNNCQVHLHHTIPKEIQKKLPPHLRNEPDIIGRAGLPNRKAVEASKHLNEVHDKTGISSTVTGIFGGKYNVRFDEEIRKIGYDRIVRQQVLDIRDDLAREFGL